MAQIQLPPGHKISILRYPPDYPDAGPWWEMVDERGPHDVMHHVNHREYGDTHLTGIRAFIHRAGPYQGQRVIFRLHDHTGDESQFGQPVDQWGRLARSLKTATPWIPWPITWHSLNDAIKQLVAMNDWYDYVRVIVAGSGHIGVYNEGNAPSVCIASYSLDPDKRPYYSKEETARGLVVMLSNERRGYPAPITLAKLAPNYPYSNLADFQARQIGARTAILRDWTGECISEFSVMNFVMLEGHGSDIKLVTPNESAAPLRGITTMTLGTLAAERHQLRLVRGRITPQRMAAARAIMATGSANAGVKIRQVIDPDRRVLWELNDPEAEAIIDALRADIWRAFYGQLEPELHREWYTPVPRQA